MARRRATQEPLAGTMDPADEQLDKLAFAYVQVRDERQALTREEVPAKERLMSAMRDKGKTKYIGDAYTIEIKSTKEVVKVRATKKRLRGEGGDGKQRAAEPGDGERPEAPADAPAAT